MLTAVSFLSFAALAAKRGLTTEAQGKKSFYYAAGLAEGGETIAVFIAFCLWPMPLPRFASSRSQAASPPPVLFSPIDVPPENMRHFSCVP